MANPLDHEFTNYQFVDIVNNCLVDVWQKTEETIANHDDEIFEDEPVITDMPTGMIVQYIPNGLLIWFGRQEDIDGEWQ